MKPEIIIHRKAKGVIIPVGVVQTKTQSKRKRQTASLRYTIVFLVNWLSHVILFRKAWMQVPEKESRHLCGKKGDEHET